MHLATLTAALIVGTIASRVAAKAPADPPTVDAADQTAKINALIGELGDRSPAVRQEAQKQLARMGRPARAALAAVAALSSSPQRRSIARELLAKLPLSDASDPPELRKVFAAYQATPTVARSEHTIRLISRGTPAGLKAAARILLEAADEETQWTIAAALRPADRDRLVALPAFRDAEPVGSALRYLTGAALFESDRTRAVLYLEQAMAGIKIAPPEARPALAHLAELLAKDAESRGDARRELAIRRDAAMLAPMQRYRVRGSRTPSPSDLLWRYFEARVRLNDAHGLADDLRSFGVPEENSIGQLIGLAISHPLAPAEEKDGAVNPAAQLRRVAPPVWEVFATLSPDDQVNAIEILRSTGKADFARVLAMRALSFGEDLGEPIADARRARLLMAQVPPSAEPAERRAAAARLRATLHGPGEVGRERRVVIDEEIVVSSSAGDDVFISQRIADVRRAMDRHDLDAAAEPLDQIAALSIDNSSLAIDAIYVLEHHGRMAEADEIYAEYFDQADAQRRAMPENPSGMNGVAWFCARTGRNLEYAASLAEQAIRISPNSAYLDTFAEAVFRLGRVEEAISAETQALRSRKNDAFMLRQVDRFKAGLGEGDADRALPSESWDR